MPICTKREIHKYTIFEKIENCFQKKAIKHKIKCSWPQFVKHSSIFQKPKVFDPYETNRNFQILMRNLNLAGVV